MVAKKEENKKFNKDKFVEIIFFIISLSIFCVLLFSNIKIARERLSLIEKVESLSQKVEFLEDQKEMLKARISDAETGDYWEEVMREQGYVREGEESVVILSPEKRESSVEEEKYFFQDFWERIRKLFVWPE